MAQNVPFSTLPVSPGRRLMRFAVALAVFWLVVFVVAPFVQQSIPPFRIYGEKAEEAGIHPGALYYTDVPLSTDAEMNSRSTVRFFSGKRADQTKKTEP